MGSVGGAHAPHFMSPTIASKLSQTQAPDTRPTTPVSIKSVRSDRGQSLLQSAVQRVGRRKVATDDTTPGKNHSPTKYRRAIVFPDKLSTPLHKDQSSSPVTTPKNKSGEKPISPLDKPLPALPKMEPNIIESGGPSDSKSQMINEQNQAVERNVRPSDEGLDPKLLQTPKRDSLQKLMATTGRELVKQSSQHERYPALANTTQQRQTAQQHLLVSRYSPKFQGTQEEKSSTAGRKPANDTGSVLTGRLSDPFGGAAEPPKYHPATKDEQNLSAAAAALEKAESETRMDQTPRQTRTSSLRARLSAGQLVKNSQNKVLGFTDFTVSSISTDSVVDLDRNDSQKEPPTLEMSDGIKPSLQVKGSKSTLRTKTSLHSIHSNVSTESLAKGHATAQFIGGSRRTRSRSVSREPKPTSVSRKSEGSTIVPSKSSARNNEDPDHETQAKSRKSSLPVPTHGALSAKFKPQNTGTLVSRKPSQSNANPRSGVSIQQDHLSTELLSDHLEIAGKSAFQNRGTNQIFNDAQEYKSLKAIEESPQPKFTVKRLSVKAPDYGPKLRISPSAERFIMGDNNDKENQVLPGKLSKKLFQRSANGTYKKQYNTAGNTPAFKRQSGRPVSIHETPQSSPRVSTFAAAVRERKVKSADMSSMLSNEMATAHDPSRQNTDASKGSKASSHQSFYSADEEGSQPANGDVKVVQSQNNSNVFIDKDTSTSGPKDAIDQIKEDSTKNDSPTDSTRAIQSLDRSPPKEASYQSPTNAAYNDKDVDVTPKITTSTVTVKHTPVTPIDKVVKSSSQPSHRHPPRSSSRITPPNLMASTSTTEQTNEEKAPRAPPKDEDRLESIQNSLGSRHGHTSWQVDVADLASKRNSILHERAVKGDIEPENTPTTVKKSFSSFRNLFNKRTPVAESKKPNTSEISNSKPSTKAKQAKQKAKRISDASIGSPRTPLPSKHSHPSHRSTISSSIRATPSPPKNNLATTTASPASTAATPSSATAVATPTSLASPTPITISTSTNLAMSLLDAARAEQSSPKKEKLLQMSKILVDALTQARDAEKAAEEAKMASRRAEMAKEICGKMVEEVGRAIGEWSGTVLEGFRGS